MAFQMEVFQQHTPNRVLGEIIGNMAVKATEEIYNCIFFVHKDLKNALTIVSSQFKDVSMYVGSFLYKA